jgi:TonB-linked SusC/RagA family outer membrane protein
MKSKLLSRVWIKAISVTCGFILPCFLCNALWAKGANPVSGTKTSITYTPNKLFDKIIKGQVTDEKGLPIPGVTVSEKGSSQKAITDQDGKFSISVSKANSTLVFSYIGYLTTEVQADASGTMTVKMTGSVKTLDDVVVVGYGTQKKKELSNAVSQVGGGELIKSQSASTSNSLAGRLPGLFVTQSSAVPGQDDAKILVRGPSTYRNTSALIVIDGVANADPDGLNRLDPNDIETISVLKDAAAAVYGAQSAGGVILVTTKRGKAGKAQVDISTTESFQSPTTKTKSAGIYDYINAVNSRDALLSSTPSFPDAFIQAFKSGQRRPEDWFNALVAPPAALSRQSATIRGGTDKARYFISAGIVSQGGILRGDNITKLNQYNVRSNIDVDVTKNLSVGVDLSYREKYNQQPQGGAASIGAFANTSPTQEAYVGGDYRYPAEGWSQLNPAARLLSPGYQRATTDVAMGTFKFKYNMPFVKGLALDGFASIVKTNDYGKNFNYTWFFYQKDLTTGQILKLPSRPVEPIGLTEADSLSKRTTQNLRLTYNRTFGGHKIDAFVAYEQMDFNKNYFWTNRLNYTTPLIDQLSAGSLDHADWNNYGSAAQEARQNFFGRVNYDYQGRYLVSLSARYDGSAIFPPNSRWGFFPQVSAGWVITNESFMPNTSAVNFLKLRASWGQLGNDRVAPFQYLTSYGYAPGYVINGADVQGVTATSTANPNITWEVSAKTDIGLDAAFLSNKLNLTLDYFNTNTSRILGQKQASIPSYTGLVLPDQNIGKMNSRGFEVQVDYKQNFGRVGFRAGANVSYATNKIIYFDETPQSEPYQKLEGNPLGSILVYKAIGIYRTDADLTKYTSYPGAIKGNLIFADLNHDGIIDSRDQYRMNAGISPDGQYAIPKAQFGANFGVSYQNFDLAILLQGQTGAKWRMSNGFDSGAGGNGLEYVAVNSYTLTNPNAILPMVSPQGVGGSDADFYYHVSTFLRFKNAQLGYTLPKHLLSWLKITAFRVYVSGDNLFMIYNNLKKYGTGDPEFLLGNGGAYPNMKTVSIGANLTF